MSLSRQSIALVLTTKNNQTQHYIHQKHKRETEKTALANKTIYTLIWYGFYNLWSRNGVGPILTAPEPTQGNTESNSHIRLEGLTSHSTHNRSFHGSSSTTSGQEKEWALYLRPQSPHGALRSSVADIELSINCLVDLRKKFEQTLKMWC